MFFFVLGGSGFSLLLLPSFGTLGGEIMENHSSFFLRSSLDLFSSSFLFFLGIIVISVVVYSFFYLKSESSLYLFLSLLGSFGASMAFLVMGFTLPSAIFGWEGLGASSFLLILYYSSWYSLASSQVTFLVNRAGDGFFLVCLSLLLIKAPLCTPAFVFFLMVACFSKSAQLPLSVWLPEAMAAPTPVSALVHSSTLVSAGVYLALRSISLPSWSIWVCGGTSALGAISALSEKDLKKMVAMSTLSQLGFMLVPLTCFFGALCGGHMLLHAFFKALLFLSVGVFIVVLSSQSRALGASLSYPLCSFFFKLSLMSMMGVSFLSAFFSKDQILESSLGPLGKALKYLMVLSMSGLTFLYSLAALKTFSGKESEGGAKGESKLFPFFPLFLLSSTLFSLPSFFFKESFPYGPSPAVLSFLVINLIFSVLIFKSPCQAWGSVGILKLYSLKGYFLQPVFFMKTLEYSYKLDSGTFSKGVSLFFDKLPPMPPLSGEAFVFISFLFLSLVFY